MAEQTGPSAAAIGDREAALSARAGHAADADQLLAGILREAHAASVAARQRLDAVADEIEARVADHATAGGPLSARELQRFLLGKQRELAAIVAEAQRDDAAKRALLEALRGQYPSAANPS